MKTFAIALLLNEVAAVQLVKKSSKKFTPVSNLSDEEIGYKARSIIDKDGDGVEDNVKLTHAEIERYYKPHYFGVSEDIHNTHNGELPGHHRFGDDNLPGRHASHTLNDPYEKERNASVYPMPPGEPNSKAASDAASKDKADDKAAEKAAEPKEPAPEPEAEKTEAKTKVAEEQEKKEAAAAPKEEKKAEVSAVDKA